MKVVAFNGSPRKGGNTEILLNTVLEVLKAEGIETELIHVGNKAIRGCRACRMCFENADRKCVIPDEHVNGWIEKAAGADGILLGSPTYFADLTPELKAFMDRLGYVSMANGGLLHHKVGAGVVAVRRGGATHVLDSINHLFLISQMLVVGSTYWNMGYGREKGEVLNDEEALRNMRNLGENMAWALKKLHG